MKNQGFPRRLRHAALGLVWAWRRENSFRIQAAAAVLAGTALLILRPPAIWWAVVALVIAVVLAAELFNAAIEALSDHLHPDLHPEIRIVKDLAAAAVLCASAGALIIGLSLIVSLL
jgi:diacylglycerol kinase